MHLLQALPHKVMEGQGPFVCLSQPGWRLPADHEDDPHGMHSPAWGCLLGHLYCRDAQCPDIDLHQSFSPSILRAVSSQFSVLRAAAQSSTNRAGDNTFNVEASLPRSAAFLLGAQTSPCTSSGHAVWHISTQPTCRVCPQISRNWQAAVPQI